MVKSFKDKLLSFFKLKTINSQSVVEVNDLLIFAKKSFADGYSVNHGNVGSNRICSIQLKNDCRCNITGKLIIVPDWVERKKYVSFSWLLACIVAGHGDKYFLACWLKKLV